MTYTSNGATYCDFGGLITDPDIYPDDCQCEIDRERDLIAIPVEFVTVGMTGPGGMLVESITPDPARDGGLVIDLGTMRANVSPAMGHVLSFPIRPARPAAFHAEPDFYWSHAERESWHEKLTR